MEKFGAYVLLIPERVTDHLDSFTLLVEMTIRSWYLISSQGNVYSKAGSNNHLLRRSQAKRPLRLKVKNNSKEEQVL